MEYWGPEYCERSGIAFDVCSLVPDRLPVPCHVTLVVLIEYYPVVTSQFCIYAHDLAAGRLAIWNVLGVRIILILAESLADVSIEWTNFSWKIRNPESLTVANVKSFYGSVAGEHRVEIDIVTRDSGDIPTIRDVR